MPADLERARAALRAAGDRTSALLRGIDPARKATGLSWTLGEVGAHLVIALRAYTDSVSGSVNAWADVMPADPTYRERMTAVTGGTLQTETERDPAALSTMVSEAVDRYLKTSAGLPANTIVATPWYAPDATLPLSAATCLLLGEQLIHGGDMARSMSLPWPISREDALLLTHAMTAMLPVIANPAAIDGVRVSYAIHLRGGPAFYIGFDNGAVELAPLTSQRVSCHLLADPATFVLVGYGRVNQWSGIGRGKLLAWGRRPWAALRLTSYFYTP